VIVATHQPNYFPWLGYFYKIWKSDFFVFLDDVQFSKKGMHNFHFLRKGDESVKLNIPVKHAYTDPINKVITNDAGGWKGRHLELIRDCYAGAPFFAQIFDDIQALLAETYPDLSALNIAIIKKISAKFGLATEFVRSSSLEVNETNELRIIGICKKLNATVYYSGRGAKAYQSEENFNANGLQLVYDDYVPPVYSQMGDGFIQNVSIIDFLMNHGYDWEFITSKFGKQIAL